MPRERQEGMERRTDETLLKYFGPKMVSEQLHRLYIAQLQVVSFTLVHENGTL